MRHTGREGRRGDNLILIGFMAAGKGAVARELGLLLGRAVLDTDDVAAALAGDSIPRIFAKQGERVFRRLEAAAVRAAAALRSVVIATGGGAVLDDRNVRTLRGSGSVVWLMAAADAVLERSGAGTPAAAARPLLTGLSLDDAARRVSRLLHAREPAYLAAADIAVDTAGRTPGEVAGEICLRLGLVPGARPAAAPEATPCPLLPPNVACGQGLLGDGKLFDRLPASVRGRRCLLVTDPVVGSLYGSGVEKAARQAGIQLTATYVPAGERAKRLAVVEGLYQAMLDSGLGRDGLVLALGGGAVGDTAGFAAATYMRGIPYVQLPTTLLAQADSALGGKTAVDLGTHKNTVGAFHQPAAVVADVACLATLPGREFRSGLAEVLKYGLLFDRALWEDAAEWGRSQAAAEAVSAAARAAAAAAAAQARSNGHAATLITRCLAHKAAVAAADERDTGAREVLNFGHTLGHALEARASGRLRHGEAVAWGMHFAVWLGERLGRTASGTQLELSRRLGEAGFARPRVAGGAGAAGELLSLMLKDKKVRGGRLRVVLLRKLGEVHEAAGEVDREVAERAISDWLQLDHRDWSKGGAGHDNYS